MVSTYVSKVMVKPPKKYFDYEILQQYLRTRVSKVVADHDSLLTQHYGTLLMTPSLNSPPFNACVNISKNQCIKEPKKFLLKDWCWNYFHWLHIDLKNKGESIKISLANSGFFKIFDRDYLFFLIRAVDFQSSWFTVFFE